MARTAPEKQRVTVVLEREHVRHLKVIEFEDELHSVSDAMRQLIVNDMKVRKACRELNVALERERGSR